jgi:ABC-type dipeptide/oligopeptide/nickel transport system permease subunit
MRYARWASVAVLLAVAVLSLAANWVAPANYATQFRDFPNAAPSRAHWLGTDQLGRDRFARLLYGTRLSLLLAPAAALLSTALAALIGGVAGYRGGMWQQLAWRPPTWFFPFPGCFC